ncbi:protein of unknown function [Paenibacillus alvei]|uniref:Uncharacterized protein n=1 Tax=Paenibacillus alvei TaxID=44250 RepID=A0A383R458_PAEAL|nr:protein of unknown function [Paenibacillus alvei]
MGRYSRLGHFRSINDSQYLAYYYDIPIILYNMKAASLRTRVMDTIKGAPLGFFVFSPWI